MTFDASGYPELTVEAVRGLAPSALLDLGGRTALVTGAAGGVGRWLAAALGAAGARVALTDVDGSSLEEVGRVLDGAGIESTTVVADLVEVSAAAELVERCCDAFGGLDVLVNCAALNRRAPILEVDEELYDLVMAVDLRAPFFLAQRAAHVMSQSDGGSIINIGSINVAVALESVSVYGPAKAALSQLTKVMAVEWAHLGIRANCISPGFMYTPLSASLWAEPERRRWMMERIPQLRPGRPDELTGLCVLLASETASYITGQTLYVDGGFLAGSRWYSD